ncbi:MAG: ABC transporter permease, partial [Candidatus Eremiobacteraeota bacterium]|nr:ABC transporter permease [Candidatus Eremiobacteraeota bacterium]
MRAFGALFRALVWRHALLHRTRTLLTLASVAVGVALFVAIRLANESAVAAFQGAAHTVAAGSTLQVVASGDGIADRVVAQLARMPDVSAVAPVVSGTLADEREQQAYDFLGVDLIAAIGLASSTATPLSAPEGVRLSPDILQRGEIIISQSLARRWHLAVGGRKRFVAGTRTVSLQVGATLPDAWLPTGMTSAVIADLSTAQETLGRNGLLDRIDIVPREGLTVSRLAAQLHARLPAGLVVTTSAERARESVKMTDAFRFNLAALAAIALLVGAFLVFNAVSMSVVQRRPEIGVVRALGAPRRTIFTIFALEGLGVGVLGSIAGILIGRLMAEQAVAVVGTTINALYATVNGLSVAHPAPVYVVGAALGVSLSALAAAWPAHEAASISPSTAVRVGSWEPVVGFSQRPLVLAGCVLLLGAALLARVRPVGGEPVFGYGAALLVIIAGSLFAGPLLLLLARGARRVIAQRLGPALVLSPLNLQARMRRNAVAVATLMIGVAMTVSVATLIGSFRQTVITWIDQTVRGDLYVGPAGAVNAADVTMSARELPAVQRLPGVAAVDALRSRVISYAGRLTNLAAADSAVIAGRAELPLLNGGSWRVIAPLLRRTNAVIVSEPFMRKFGVGSGDTLALQTPAGERRFAVVGVYRDYASDLGYVFMDRGRYVRLFQDTQINAIALYAAPGASLRRLRTQVLRVFGDQRVSVAPNAQLRAEGLAQFDRTFAVTYALNAIALFV